MFLVNATNFKDLENGGLKSSLIRFRLDITDDIERKFDDLDFTDKFNHTSLE